MRKTAFLPLGLLLTATSAFAQPPAAEEPRETPSRFELKPGGYVHADGRFFLGDEDEVAPHSFLLRRVRLILDGTIGDWFAARIMVDFGSNGASGQGAVPSAVVPSVLDAYADFTPFSWLGLRVGKTKSPFGVERLQSAANRSLEVSIVTQLVPNRDVGAMLFGEIGDGLLEYHLGVFDGTGDGASVDFDLDRDKELAARIFVRPLASAGIDALADLGVGVAVTWGATEGSDFADVSNATASNAEQLSGLTRYRTAGNFSFFRYRTGSDPDMPGMTTVADGTRFRISPQLYWAFSRFSVLAEYVSSSTEVRIGTRSETLTHTGLHGLVSVLLTDDEASFEGVKPAAPFDPELGNIGAIELAARFATVSIDEDAFPTFADPARAAEGATSIGGGVNWHLNRGFRLGVYFEHTSFAGDADFPAEDLILTRAQARF